MSSAPATWVAATAPQIGQGVNSYEVSLTMKAKRNIRSNANLSRSRVALGIADDDHRLAHG